MGVSSNSVLNRLLQNTNRHHKSRPHDKPKGPPNTTLSSTAHILSLLDSGHLKKAVSLLFSTPTPFPLSIYAHLLRVCSSKRALVEVRKIESHLITSYPSPPTFLLNRAVEVYAKCGNLRDARELFDEMPKRDGGTWNAMITGYAQAGRAEEALMLFSGMGASGLVPNEITFASVLGSCAALFALFLAKQIHGLVIKFGFCWNVILGSSLVDIYGKCRVIDDARRAFHEIPTPNAVSWNVIVRRYLEMGEEKEAVVMFFKMIRENARPLNFTFSNVLIACSSISALEEGRQIHGIAVKTAFEEDNVVTTSLIDMYAKCSALEDAHRLFDRPRSRNVVSWTSIVSGYAMCGRISDARMLFDKMPERNVISWNAMLAGYTRFFYWDEALDFIFWMRHVTSDIDHVTLGLILNVCAGLSDLRFGKQVHGFVYRHGFCSNLFTSNALLNMYGKCGSLRSARLWFLEMGRWRDKISWNALITGYARHGQSEEALRIFSEMQWETTPSKFTFSTIFAACANIFTLDHGKEIHGYMIRHGFEMDIVIKGALVDMYSKCRCLEYAVTVFREEGPRDLILWNSMILGCAYNGRGSDALELFESMQKEGIEVDNVTFIGVLLACIGEGFVDLGRQYFNSMSDKYCTIPRVEHYECMIELLGKHGIMDELEDFVRRMPFEPTVPMWTRVFDCCREHGNSRLGELASQRLSDLNPSNPVCFEILSETNLDT
ncbi:pentatricopeptide repeat-containing protein At3g26540 [Magnolia sinica]|uniref:pentatricopeptide repeat-containing protein At3g26540 n=1 Tax=Magnolia sinica TaxID=86752 RepID=UPI002659AB4D|nr:pentatricopeptide repeat-containing protein At3g26540 [Magnolia sinica]